MMTMTNLGSLDLEKMNIGVEPDRWIGVSEIDHTPDVGAEPDHGTDIRLVLSDQDWMRYWQQTNKSSILQELQDLRLVLQRSIKREIIRLVKTRSNICRCKDNTLTFQCRSFPLGERGLEAFA